MRCYMRPTWLVSSVVRLRMACSIAKTVMSDPGTLVYCLRRSTSRFVPPSRATAVFAFGVSTVLAILDAPSL